MTQEPSQSKYNFFGNTKITNFTDSGSIHYQEGVTQVAQDLASSAPVPKKLVLFLAANPTNIQRLDLDKEVQVIQEQLKRSDLTLTSRWRVRPFDIQQEILSLKPQIVHFSGHGMGQELPVSGSRTLIPVGGNYSDDTEGLMFIDGDTDQAVVVGAETLASLFENFKEHVECVVLNGCYSEVQAAAIARHIPYVIGMKHAILDRAAIEFSRGFYNALADGEAIESAFKLGKSAIRVADMPDYQFPVLLPN